MAQFKIASLSSRWTKASPVFVGKKFFSCSRSKVTCESFAISEILRHWPKAMKKTGHVKHCYLLEVILGQYLSVTTRFEAYPYLSVAFLAFYDRGGVDSTSPPENNITVELGQWNVAHVCTCQKTTSVPNLVAIARSVTSLWRHQCFFDNDIKGFAYVCKSSFISLWNFPSTFIWLFGILGSCSLHFNLKIAKSLKKLLNSGLQKPLK